MTTANTSQQKGKQRRSSWPGKLLGAAVRLSLVVLIIAGAVAAFGYQMRTSPRAKRKKPPRQAKLVEVIPVQKDDCVAVIRQNGTVIPAQQVTLQPQVAGQIVEISPDVVPGCMVEAGQKLVAIDRRDYDTAVEQAQSTVAMREKDLKLERGNQAVARQEYELLGEVIADEDRELVLREPQLASAQAALKSAQAALKKSQLNLARCEISAPFNAIVQRKHVDLGATVATNSQLVTLIGTDEAWIEVLVPTDELQWLYIPQSNGDRGSSVTIRSSVWGPKQSRIGQVVRLYGELEPQGRMAQLLVTVDDPFCLKPENRDQPQLLIGSYVRTEIQGRTLTSVFPIDWSHRRDNDTVWIMNGQGELEIRSVEIVFRGAQRVYVGGGLSENEQLVVTDIAAPVAGMPLRVAQADEGQAVEGPVQVAERGGQH
ncbi:MAG: efflux RND transporter periplasmic adaptor subunit [Sedimentisphaerales bacterium]|nr:efflux RND transporter periplasmic adaptor subunit [Sedimentisphaerales bacterium]